MGGDGEGICVSLRVTWHAGAGSGQGASRAVSAKARKAGHRGQGNVWELKVFGEIEELCIGGDGEGLELHRGDHAGHVPVLEGNCASTAHQGRGSVTWRIASGEREGMDAGIGAKATSWTAWAMAKVCVSLQA